MILSIVALAIVLTCMLGYVAYHGRKARRTKDWTVIAHHRGGTNCVMWLALITILMIELMIRQLQLGHPPILYVHLPLAFTFAALFLLMRFRFDGLRSSIHRHLAYGCLTAYTGALITGGIMLSRI